ncbi:DNA repair RAD52-like protein 1, mitochondrial [Bidens hawaiensis]|uniref:DNA repair RAD52-like protein 1, mitochondrial n=1 Tax=Bidens hawaiensis TaxID=980011 RepID=UPI00404ABA90
MALCLPKSLLPAALFRLRSPEAKPTYYYYYYYYLQTLLYSSTTKRPKKQETITTADEINEIPIHPSASYYDAPPSGISEILKELNKKVPDSLIRTRTEPDGFTLRHLPWHIVNRIMNLHAPEWSGEVRSITYSADGKYVTVTYRVTIYGTDAELYRESTGTASVDGVGYGDPVQKAEAMAFRRACARFGLGLHLYHEEL